MIDTRPVAGRAIKHYAKRLRDLVKEDKDERIQVVKEGLLKEDLSAEAEEVEKIQVVEGMPVQERQQVCSALTCYINDLEQSKTAVRNKLTVSPLFKHIDAEITIASEAKGVICKYLYPHEPGD